MPTLHTQAWEQGYTSSHSISLPLAAAFLFLVGMSTNTVSPASSIAVHAVQTTPQTTAKGAALQEDPCSALNTQRMYIKTTRSMNTTTPTTPPFAGKPAVSWLASGEAQSLEEQQQTVKKTATHC